MSLMIMQCSWLHSGHISSKCRFLNNKSDLLPWDNMNYSYGEETDSPVCKEKIYMCLSV